MITIIDYDIGNLRNVQKAFEFNKAEARITNRFDEIDRATALVLPGVGHFHHGMENLEKTGMDKLICKKVLEDGIPILGICLGMQLLSKTGYENGERPGLGLLEMETKSMQVTSSEIRIPHMGWNSVEIADEARLFRGIPNFTDFYFVHSCAVQTSRSDIVSSRCSYGQDFVSSVEIGNIYATQFHPEKSQMFGLQIINNFVDIANESNNIIQHEVS